MLAEVTRVRTNNLDARVDSSVTYGIQLLS